MRNISLPTWKRECRHVGNELCTGELRYYMEAPAVLDLYHCSKCYRIAEWDGTELRGTEMEAYQNRDKEPD